MLVKLRRQERRSQGAEPNFKSSKYLKLTSMGNFKKGLFLGGLVGAALMWLNATPKGKEMRAKLVLHLEPLYVELKASLKQLEGPTKEMYDALVERAVEEYGAKKQLAGEMRNVLMRELKKKWHELEKELNQS